MSILSFHFAPIAPKENAESSEIFVFSVILEDFCQAKLSDATFI